MIPPSPPKPIPFNAPITISIAPLITPFTASPMKEPPAKLKTIFCLAFAKLLNALAISDSVAEFEKDSEIDFVPLTRKDIHSEPLSKEASAI